MVGFAGNLREFPLRILCGDGARGTICMLVPLCALIAQTEGFRFRPPHSHSFLVIPLFRGRFCRDFARICNADTMRRWCRRINLQARTALCGDCINGGFAFSASPFLQLLSNMYFALVQLLFRGMAYREFDRISIDGIIRRWCRRNNLQARSALCVDCTNGGFAISASPFPQILAHM